MKTVDPQWKRDQRDLAKIQAEARRAFRLLIPRFSDVSAQARLENPGDPKLQGKSWLKQVQKASPKELDEFLNTFFSDSEKIGILSTKTKASTLALMRDVSLGSRKLLDAMESLDLQVQKVFQATILQDVQGPLNRAIPEDLREFLPKNVVVEVDSEGYISKVTDRFENERLTLGSKIERMKTILREYNKIVKQVKKDLDSKDETTRMSAIITSIVMETGIRPGGHGNAAMTLVNGEKVLVETFGAITLGPQHVKFVKENFASLEFVGKLGTFNTAKLSDQFIIKVLQEYVDRALTKGSKFIFVTNEGEPYSYSDLMLYFRHNFSGISVTDFRKLKATETVLSALREEQEGLYKRIDEFSKTETEELKKKVVDALVDTLKRAIHEASKALSHESSGTTIHSYIDPQILLRFLSTGKAEENLTDAILEGKTKLVFDPQKFIEIASSRSVVSRFLREGATLNLKKVLTELISDLSKDIT